MRDTINILCSMDGNYVPYYGVMLTSLFLSNKEEQFEVYVITNDTHVEAFDTLQQLVERYHYKLHIIQISHELISRLKSNQFLGGHLSIATYYRLLSVGSLPNDVRKILYMDGDMVVDGSIRPLWNIDVSQVGLAGAIDCLYFDPDIYLRLDYPSTRGYFNAGVLLLNLDYLREHNFTETALSFMEQNRDKLRFHDQDVLNKVLADAKTAIPLKYNFQYFYVMQSHWEHYNAHLKADIKAEAEHPIIVHYCGPGKPWHMTYIYRPYDRLWWKYAVQSLWHIRRQWKPVKRSIKWLIKVLLMKVHIWSRTHLGLPTELVEMKLN